MTLNLAPKNEGAQSSDWFTRFVEIIPFVPYVCSAEAPFQPVFLGPALKRYTGYDPPEFLETPDFWTSRVHPADRQRLQREAIQLLSAGSGAVEYRFLHKDGSYRWVRDERIITTSSDGQAKINGYWIDITDRKRAEEAHLHSERMFGAVVENSSDAIVLFNAEQKGVYASPAMHRILGYGLEVVKEGTRFDLFHPDDALLMKSAWNRTLIAPDDVIRLEVRCKHADGRYVWLEITLQNLLSDPTVGAIVSNFRDISLRKRVEERFRAEYKGVPLPTYTYQKCGDDFCLVDFNDAAVEYNKGELEEFKGMFVRSIFHDRPDVVEHFGECYRQRTSIRKHVRYRPPTATEDREYEATYVFVPPDMITVHTEDITDRKKAAERIHFQASLLDQISSSVIATDIQGRIIYWNRFAERMYGWKGEEVRGRELVPLLVPDTQWERSKERLSELAQKGKTEGELILRKKDGTIFPALFNNALIYDAEGKTIGMVGVSVDISDRKRSEEALRESEERFRQLAENVEAVFWLASPSDSGALYVSPAYEKIWGRKLDSLYADKFAWLEAVVAEDLDGVREHIKKARDVPIDFECRIARPDGVIRWIRCRTSPVRDETGRTYRVAGIVEDITEFRRLETEVLKISEREQARIGQDLHDGLGQHLTGIALLCQALQEKLGEQTLRESVDASQIRTLIDDAIKQTRTLARVAHPLDLETDGLYVALENLASKAEEIFHATCKLELSTPLEVTDPYTALHLYRIIQEAITNSIRHGKARVVRIAVNQEGNHLIFSVKDDGTGIQPHAQNGGMGLRIMQYRARMIHGSVDIHNDLSGGAIVTCTIPVTSARPNLRP
jgi:PAS domain S-box-containing protein